MSKGSSTNQIVAAEQVRILLTLVPYLFERGEVSVADAAAEFDTTPAQMRTMVQRLTLVGLPGSDGYFQMPHEMFDIDWDLLDEHDRISIRERVALERAPKLSAREAAALLAGLQLAKTIPGIAENEVVQALSQKLARGTSGTPATLVIADDERADETRRLVAEAVSARRTLVFTYRAPDRDPLERTVDPTILSITDGQWYLQGWDHLRRAQRTFLLDRITAPRLEGTFADPGTVPAHGDGAEPPSAEQPEETVTVRFPTDRAAVLGDYLRDAAVHSDDGSTTVTLRLGEGSTLKRLAARAAGHVEIMAPPAARTAALEWAQRALELYRSQD